MSLHPVLVPEVLSPRRDRSAQQHRARTSAAIGIAIGLTAAVLVGRSPTADTPAPHVAEPVRAGSGAITPPVAPVAAAIAPRHYGPEAFAIDMAPVIADGGLRVVLRGKVDKGWVEGKPSMTDDEGLTVVTRSLSAAGRAQVAHAVGARLRLHGADGHSCLARISGVVAVARLDAGGNLDEGGGARAAWDAASGTQVIAGDLQPLEGSCDDVAFARSEFLPAPRIAVPVAAAPEVQRAAAAALRARPEYREMTDGTGAEHIEAATISAGGETLVLTTFLAEGCNGEEPALIAIWSRDAGGQLHFLGAEEMLTAVTLATDADGDGRLELVAQENLLGVATLRRSAPGRDDAIHMSERAAVPVLGCRC